MTVTESSTSESSYSVLNENSDGYNEIKYRSRLNSINIRNDTRYTFWESLGNPKFILGPMVDQSDLAFRLLTLQYGTDLCYTPMLNSKLFALHPKYRLNNFQTCDEDIPVIAQFCGDDFNYISKSAQLVASENPNVKAIDINFGCPQVKNK